MRLTCHILVGDVENFPVEIATEESVLEEDQENKLRQQKRERINSTFHTDPLTGGITYSHNLNKNNLNNKNMSNNNLDSPQTNFSIGSGDVVVDGSHRKYCSMDQDVLHSSAQIRQGKMITLKEIEGLTLNTRTHEISQPKPLFLVGKGKE